MSLTLDELLSEVASAPSVTPADQDPRLGTQVGPYKIMERLGRGGMGTVYLARDTRLRRDVALKMLHDESPLACQELLREARRAATVSHSSIAQVFDVSEGVPPYIAMELVEGDSLHERIAKSPPSRSESLRILGDVADAVTALHAQGIVHRDLTPRNIAITADGCLKILDFGIAMPLEGDDHHTERESVRYAGTERYVAPERADGGAPSAKEDVFSFGVLASDLFANERPPASVADLLERCRSADESMRPSDFGAIAQELRDAIAAPKPRLGLLLVLSLIVAAFGFYVVAKSSEAASARTNPTDTSFESRAQLPPTRLTFYAEDQAIQDLSGSGDVFFVTDTLGVSRFDGANESERLWLPEGFRATSAHETASGVLIVGDTLEERDAFYYSGEVPHILVDGGLGTLSVAHDGRRVAILEPHRIRIGLLNSEHDSLLESESSIPVDLGLTISDQRVSWSPDDRRLLLLTWHSSVGRLEEIDVATGRRRTVFESPDLVGRLGTYAFTYIDDETVAFSLGVQDEASVGLYIMSLSPAEEPRLVATLPTSIQDLHWCPSRNSFRFVAYDPDYKIYRRLVAANEPQRMTFSDHQDWVTDFSEDGEEIHFSRMNASGARAFTVPRSSPSSEEPILLDSPSPLPNPTRVIRQATGAWLAFLPREEHYELQHITSAATRSLAHIQSTPGDWRSPPFGAQVRRGGGRLYYGVGEDETLRIFKVDGSLLREPIVVEGSLDSWFAFAVSQDGEHFVYRDPEGLVLIDAHGVTTQRISLNSTLLQTADFLRDGSLIITAASTRQFSLLHMDLESGETNLLASSYHRWFGSVATSPTRDEFAYTTVGWDTDVFEIVSAQ